MEPDLADRIYELDRCIECGCCVAACGTARMRKDFVGAVGLNRVARFRLDPRDARTDDDLLRRDRRRRRRLRLHVAARLPRRLSEEPAARHADRVHAAQDGQSPAGSSAMTGGARPRYARRVPMMLISASGAPAAERTRGATTMRLAKFVKFREEKFGGVLFETRSEKVFTLNPTATAVVREIAAGGDEQRDHGATEGSFRRSRRRDRARSRRRSSPSCASAGLLES